MEIIPAVDVLGGEVVRLLRGDYEQVTSYASDPVAKVEAWVEQGAGLVHVVDLGGARSGEPDRHLWRRLGEAGLPVQIGGGIRDAETARAALGAGARRVVMGSAAVWEPAELARVGEPGRVVAAVDVKGGRATGGGWLDAGRGLTSVMDGLGRVGIERLLVTGISRDGTMAGPEIDLMEAVIADGRFRVIASGGVGALADIEALAGLGCEAAIVGRALYEGRFTLAEAMAAVA